MDGFIRAANLGVVVEGSEPPAGDNLPWWALGVAGMLALLATLVLLTSRRGRHAR